MCLMQANFEVSQVVLTNRQECCRCPLAGANIYIGNPSNLNVIALDNPDLSKETTWQLCATVRPWQALLSSLLCLLPCTAVSVAHLPSARSHLLPMVAFHHFTFCNVIPLAFRKPCFLLQGLHPCFVSKAEHAMPFACNSWA